MINYFDSFLNKFQDLDEIRIALIDYGPDKFNQLVDHYSQIIDRVSIYSFSETQIIKRVYENLERLKAAGGGKELSSLEFLAQLGDKGAQLLKRVRVEIKPDSIIYDGAIVNLHNFVSAGYTLSKLNKKFSDGNAESDKVIWTQTQFSDSTRVLHILSAHFIERFVYQFFISNGIDQPFHKDALLNAMDDPILLIGLLEDNNFPIYKIWTTNKDNGGLSYINPNKIKKFQELLIKS